MSPQRVKSPARLLAFTLVELLVVIAIVGILAGILIPVIGKIRESGRRTVCLSNVRQIGLALLAYGNDNKGWGPVTRTNRGLGSMRTGNDYNNLGLLLPYMNWKMPPATQNTGTPAILRCPGQSETRDQYFANYPGYETSYWLSLEATSDQPESIKLINIPPQRVVVAEYCRWWEPRPDSDNHAGKGIHVFRMNGSVTWLPAGKTAGLPAYDWSALDGL